MFMFKSLKSLIFLLSIIYSISIDPKYLEKDQTFKPFVSVPSLDSFQNIVTNLDEKASFVEEEKDKDDKVNTAVRCLYLDKYDIYDISGLCATDDGKNKEVARQYEIENKEESNKKYTIYVNFCRNLKGSDTCNKDNEKSQAYYKAEDGDCKILAGDIGSGNQWTIKKENTTDGEINIISILVNKKGNHTLTYELQCDSKMKKNAEPDFIKDRSHILGNEEIGFDVLLRIKSSKACVTLDFYFIVKFIEDYKVIFAIIMMLIGLFNCCLGKKLAKYNSFLLCIIIITVLVLVFSQYVLPSGCAEWIIWVMLAVGILLGGTAGYFVFKYHDKVLALITGGVSGFFIGEFLYNLFGNRIEVNGIIINIVFVVVAIGVMIAISYFFKKFIIIFSTSFIGAYIFIRGISLLAGSFPDEVTVMDLNGKEEPEQLKELLTWQVYVYLAAILITTGLSIYLQYKFNKDKGEDGEEDSKDKNLVKSSE